jgi:hypothetical protein
MDNVIFVSYYTVCYEKQAEKLIRSLNRWNLKHEVEHMKSKGTWTDNLRQKPAFMLEKVKKHRKNAKAIVWVDADAVVRAFPSLLFELDCDLAVHYRDGKELCSGTVYWSVSDVSINALQIWKGRIDRKRGLWDQPALQELLAETKMGLRIVDLPTEYCKIFDLVEEKDRNREVFPIIEHHQKSRDIKKDQMLKRAIRADSR